MGGQPMGVGHQLQAGAAMTRTLITYAALALAGLLIGLEVAQTNSLKMLWLSANSSILTMLRMFWMVVA